MKKKVLFMIASFLAAGTLNAQTVTNGAFDGNLGNIASVGVAAPWEKGCAYNTTSNIGGNTPQIVLDGNNKVLKLEGYYNPYQGGASFNMESVAQNVGPIPSGNYTVSFDARNYLQSIGNPGMRLAINLKNYTGCSWTTSHPNPEELQEVISIPLVYNFNQYSVTFCVPPSLHNKLNWLEIGLVQQQSSSTYCNGETDIDNVTFTNTSVPYDLAYEYQIDCLTGQLQVRANSPLDPSLHYLYVVMENNPNDPNNQSNAGDIQHSLNWWTTPPNSQGWYTISEPLERGKNYYLKRGIWGDCMSWKELRKYNIELQPDLFDPNFDIDVTCNDEGEAILSVTGADQQGKNPHHMFSLYEYFPGTGNPEQLIESRVWWQQSNANNYQYQQGPFSFSHPLNPTKHYYVKRGVWDACTPWREKRRYDVYGIVCPKKELAIATEDDQVIVDGFKLFPNPSKNVLTIETDLEYDEILLYSIGGKLIDTYTSSTIEVSDLKSGVYLLKLVKDNKILRSERFVKQ